MTSWEFAESMAFEHLEPDPAGRTVELLALLVTMTANSMRDRRAKPNPYTVEDFLPDPYAPPRAEREAAFAAVMATFARNSKHNKRPD